MCLIQLQEIIYVINLLPLATGAQEIGWSYCLGNQINFIFVNSVVTNFDYYLKSIMLNSASKYNLGYK